MLLAKPIPQRAIICCLVAGILAAAWLPFAPMRLFDFDAANFALALDYFQPRQHQPQPPGYPLYVGLTKIIHLFVDDVALNFLIAGLLGATAAIVMLWILGQRMYGPLTGVFAALLLMSNPILWQTAMNDQVRIYLAVISVAVALACWQGWPDTVPPAEQAKDSPLEARRWPRLTGRRLAISGLVLGVLAGFRPETLVSMTPLPIFAALRSRLKLRDYIIGFLALCAGMASWLIFLLVRVGGIQGFIAMMRLYAAEQAGRSSVLFGANWTAAERMSASGFWWASLGIAAWTPGLLLVNWRAAFQAAKGTRLFIAVWLLSQFAFSIVVHIAASGHSLGFIPILSLCGGYVLARIGARPGWLWRSAMIACVLAALSLNVWFFFEPYAPRVREASYEMIEPITTSTETTLDRIDQLVKGGKLFLVSDDAFVRWRILEYYYPDVPLLYLPAPLAAQRPSNVPLYRDRVRELNLDGADTLPLPSCGTIAWLVTDDRSRLDLMAVSGADENHHVLTTPAAPGMHFRVGRYHLATSSQQCVAK